MTPEQLEAIKSLLMNAFWIILVLFVITFVRGFLSELASGVMFRLNNKRKEQDIVYYQGRMARITKIGLTQTTMYMFDTETVKTVSNKAINGHMEIKLPQNRVIK